ncbi:NAD(P)H-dependent oxidoreductase [Caulobacter sp. DWR1-3-2b1]|uniref:NAD(P)H-dependent oxidoreductase n=1 Tax=Caulobacter sp. DWR1-3-2b1 TaxID=2804670 RepID=UPI003CFB400E
MTDLADTPAIAPEPTESRALRVLVIAGSQRRHNSCPGLDSKARALMQRMAAALPAAWQIDTEDLGNQHGQPKIQPCNACVSSSMALCVYPCNCYGPRSTTQPDLMWDLDLYGRLARADAWAFIGPTNWYGPTTNFKLMFDRLVCAAGGNPRPDLIDKKDTLKAQALERSPQWRRLTRNHLEGRTAAFFTYCDGGANEIGEDGRPLLVQRKDWFDPAQEPYRNERDAYQGLVWQCRYSGIEVPDDLWAEGVFGENKPYADDQADDMMADFEGLKPFDAWASAFIRHVEGKGLVATKEDEKAAKSTTNL